MLPRHIDKKRAQYTFFFYLRCIFFCIFALTLVNASSNRIIMVQLHTLFGSFCKIGAFTIGGGYAMIPLMEKEIVDRHRWLEQEDFMDVLTLSQAMPGIFAVNMAASVGYRLRGVIGTVTAVLGNILLPIAIMIVWAICFRFLHGNPFFEAIFKGIRPAVVALIVSPVFTMAMTANIRWSNIWIPFAAALLIWLLGVSPILIILCAGLGGFLYGHYLERKEATP